MVVTCLIIHQVSPFAIYQILSSFSSRETERQVSLLVKALFVVSTVPSLLKVRVKVSLLSRVNNKPRQQGLSRSLCFSRCRTTVEEGAHCCITQGSHPCPQIHSKQIQLMSGLVGLDKNLEFDIERNAEPFRIFSTKMKLYDL